MSKGHVLMIIKEVNFIMHKECTIHSTIVVLNNN